MRHCITCKHYKQGGSCDRDTYIEKDYVSGQGVLKNEKIAKKERNVNPFIALLSGKCGPWGIYYVEKSIKAV